MYGGRCGRPGRRLNPACPGRRRWSAYIHPMTDVTYEIEAAIEGFRPGDASRWSEVEAFVKETVAEAGPGSVGAARMWLWAASKLTSHAVLVGRPLDAGLFDRWEVERFVATQCDGLALSTRNTMRSALFRIGEAVLDDARTPKAARIGQSQPVAPYSRGEQAALRGMCRWQTTDTKKRSLAVLVAAGCGAGFGAEDTQRMKGRHVAQDADGVVWVSVEGGRRPRVVPVLERWAQILVDAAAECGEDEWLICPGRTGVTAQVDTFTARAEGEVHVDSRRLRNTWIVEHLTVGTPMVVLQAAAGVGSLEPFSRLMRFVPEPDERVSVGWLTGRFPTCP